MSPPGSYGSFKGALLVCSNNLTALFLKQCSSIELGNILDAAEVRSSFALAIHSNRRRCICCTQGQASCVAIQAQALRSWLQQAGQGSLLLRQSRPETLAPWLQHTSAMDKAVLAQGC